MKTSSRIVFLLGTLVILGAVTVIYLDTSESSIKTKQFLDDQKKLIQKSLEQGDKYISNAVETIKKETKSLLEDAANTL
jgi:hypothetical protein